MSDHLSPERRSENMRRIKSTDTAPELAVRRTSHGLGYRHRLHRKDLPGKPDLVYPKRHRAIFVHGCFWHAHNCPKGARIPKSNSAYWTAKIARNAARDVKHLAALKADGWKVMVIWECQTKDQASLARSLRRFLA